MTRVGPWTQGPDVESFQIPDRRVWVSNAVTASDAEIGPGAEGLTTTYFGGSVGGGGLGFTAVLLYLSMMGLNRPIVIPDEDDWPEGAVDIESEASQGTLVSLHVAGSLIDWGGSGISTAGSLGGRLLRVAASTWDTGVWLTSSTHLRWLSSAELSAAPIVATVAEGGSPSAVNATYTDPQTVNGFGVFVVAVDVQVFAQPWGVGDAGETRFGSPDISFIYTPPRYRYVFAGRTPIRGRQRASGVIGTIPLRGRQGDKWGLRGRQNSNL